MSTSVSVRLPDLLAVELAEVASATERSKSFVIQKALEAYLEEQADMQIALDRLNDPTDTVVSLDDMRSELGL
jgi:RHH-type transcriptional regulator, rel operon repressor / antitoxin RelB